MRTRTWWLAGWIAAGLGLILLGPLPAEQAEKAAPGAQPADAEQYKPQWKTGDQWVVETASLKLQSRTAAKPERGKPLQWQFTVKGTEKLAETPCYKVEVRCLEGKNQPVTVLWVDQRSMTLRQVQSQIMVQGNYRTVTESYQFKDRAAPVLAPLTALPLDLPVFPAGAQAKGISEDFTYKSTIGDGTKSLENLSFQFKVEQQMSPADPKEAKGLLADDFAKSIEAKPVLDVKIKSFDRNVRQLWQPKLPWPAYTDNGQTVAKLVKVTPAEK